MSAFTEAVKQKQNTNPSGLQKNNKQNNVTRQKFTSHPGQILQRKCACGGNAGHDEECEDCKKEKVFPKRRQNINSAPPGINISSPNDIYEKEADESASRIMRSDDNPVYSNINSKVSGVIQRKVNKNKSPSQGQDINEVISSSPGKSLDIDTLNFMELGFGYDFHNVKIHNDSLAHKSSEDLNAFAYTYGNHIVFAANQYQPHTFSGRKLLAHELTHIIQQNKNLTLKNKISRKANPDSEGEISVCEKYPVEEKEKKSVSGVETEKVITEPAQLPLETKAIPKEKKKKPEGKTQDKEEEGPKSVKKEEKKEPVKKKGKIDDPEFHKIIGDIHKTAVGQKKHDPAENKTSEGRNAAEKKDEEAISEGAVVLTVDENVKQPQPEFSSEKFKKELKDKISNQVPNEEQKVRQFIKTDAGVKNIVGTTQTDLKKSQEEVVSSAKNITNKKEYNPEKKQEIYQSEAVPLKKENPGSRPKITDVDRAIPKPVDPEELKMDKEHDADSLDKVMKANNLSDSQLADSNEPQFLKTLSEKQSAQKELCKVPSQLKKSENNILQKDKKDAQKDLSSGLNMIHFHKGKDFKEVDAGKKNVKSEEETRLENYYKDIKRIYSETDTNVTTSLKQLETDVTDKFQSAIDDAFKIFKENVTDRLDYYYDWHIVKRDYEKEDKITRMLNSPIESEIFKLQIKQATLLPNSPERKQIEKRIAQLQGSKRKLIIDKIFDEEKATFVGALNKSIDEIAIMVSDGLNDAKNKIAEGKTKLDNAYNGLSDENKKKAKEATDDFRAKFDDLTQKVNDKEADLVESLSKQYVESTSKLKKTFEDIRAEAALHWWERAWRKIKEVATIIYNLGKLLLNILVKAVSVIGDILAHPIRFVENLIDGIGTGFSNFKRRIGDHLRNVIFKLIIGSVPEGLKLPDTWDAKGIFGFVLEFFGFSKENIRKQAVDKFGEPVVIQLEKAFDLFIIFKNEGFSGLWNHVKEKIGDLKSQIIEEAKTFFKESILEAAVEFLLSALTPVSGFIKACKSIIGIVTFFIKNLVKLAELLNSIMDSVVDIAKGNIQNAALKVEDALEKLIVIGIKFLAALVGINLDKIQSKISRIINAIRSPVNRVINWFLDKAEAFARKSGILKLIEKGKAKIEAGKEFVREKVEAGKEKVKGAAARVLNWLKIRKTFKTPDGENHVVSIEETDGILQLMLASRKGSFLRKVEDIKIDPGDHIKVEAKRSALLLAKEIDIKIKDRTNDNVTPVEQKRITGELSKLLSNLIEETAKILPREEAVGTLILKVGDFVEIKSGDKWILSEVTEIEDNTTKFFYKSHETTKTKISGSTHFEDINHVWRKSSLEKAILTEKDMNKYNSYSQASPLPNMRIARAVLNYRRWENQRNFDSTKEWEHKVEQSTGLPEIHSAINLFWTDADFNRWLGTELGRPRQKEIVEGNKTKLVSWREYFKVHGTSESRVQFKEKLYKLRGYSELYHQGPRGYWQELKR